MMIRLAVVAALAVLVVTPALAADPLKYQRFGTIELTAPSGDPSSVAILVSGAKGWDDDARATAAALAAKGALVLGVDWKAYKAALDRSNGQSCNYPAADFQGLAQYGEKTLGLKRYFEPVLVGIGEGASVVYPAFAQGPADTFKGALAAGFCPQLKTVKPMCKGHSPDLHETATAGGFTYAPATSGLANFVTLNGVPGQACATTEAAAIIAASPGSKAIDVDGKMPLPDAIAAAYVDLATSATAFEQAQKSGDGTIAPDVTPVPGHVDISALGDLPLTLVATDGAPTSYAILMTGDGGWAGIDQSIATALAAKNVEIVGFNTLDYYWDAKSALQTAADLNRIFDAIRASDPTARVMIVGYSFGAEVAPVSYPELADTSKAMLSRMVLLVPGTLAVFEFSSSYWLGEEPSEGDNVADAVRADSNVPVLCIYSSDDDGACPALATNTPKNVTTQVLGEGHHFGGDYDALAGIIIGS